MAKKKPKSMAKRKLTAEEKLKLISDVYDKVYAETVSFYDDNVGAELAYLLAAIAQDSDVDWGQNFLANDRIEIIIRENFPAGHAVWEYIKGVKPNAGTGNPAEAEEETQGPA